VKAALELAGMRKPDLKRATGLPYTTIDSIMKRGEARCAESVRAKIARAVGLTPEMLAPGVGYLPSGDYLLHVAPPAGGDDTWLPAKSEVAIARLDHKIANAWSRDLSAGKTTLLDAFPHLANFDRTGVSDSQVIDLFLRVSLPRMLGLWRWRDQYIRGTPDKVPYADAQKFTPPMAQAWETILEPWLEGRAELDHIAFAAFMQGRDGSEREPGVPRDLKVVR
jgi:hypothetical protein